MARWSMWMTGVLLAVMLLATGLRFHKLMAQSFWNDEGNSARLSERDLGRIIEGTASDIHPPLYYIILRGWRELLGDDEFGLRSFSAFVGVLTVAATFALARRLTRRGSWVPLLAALLAAINPALIYYSQETRMYALLALLSALSTLFLLRWLQAERGRGWMVAYVLAAAAGLYTHYFFPAVLLVHGLMVLTALWPVSAEVVLAVTRPWRRTLVQWLGMVAALFLIYLPWLPIFVRQAGGRPAERAPLAEYIWDARRWLAFGPTIGPDDLVWATLALGGLLLLAIWFGRWRVFVPLVGTLTMVLLMYGVGTTQPAFFKFLSAAAPFFVIWLALAGDGFTGIGYWLLGKRSLNPRYPMTGMFSRVLAILVVGLFGLLLWGSAEALNQLYNDPDYARADYRGMVARISAEGHPNAGIILDAPNQWEVFTYYHTDGAPVYPLPLGQPDPSILEPQLAEIAADHDRIYALFWGEAQRDPERVVERWLDANAFKATDEWVGDVRFVVYAVPGEAATEMATQSGAQFGPAITLEGYTLQSDTLTPGDIVQVTLFWTSAEALDARYKIFLHVVDANGQLVAQRDSEPGGGLIPTTSWQPGETVIDNHGILLPADLAVGEYTLVVGLYDVVDSAERLRLATGGDSLVLGSIVVE